VVTEPNGGDAEPRLSAPPTPEVVLKE
jgi:hypothetical protein